MAGRVDGKFFFIIFRGCMTYSGCVFDCTVFRKIVLKKFLVDWILYIRLFFISTAGKDVNYENRVNGDEGKARHLLKVK